jgi:hypothetical protein
VAPQGEVLGGGLADQNHGPKGNEQPGTAGRLRRGRGHLLEDGLGRGGHGGAVDAVYPEDEEINRRKTLQNL